jgi:hypothetical protein
MGPSYSPYPPPLEGGGGQMSLFRLLNMGPRSQNWVPVFAGLVDGSFASLQRIPIPAIGAPLDMAIQLRQPPSLGEGRNSANWAIPIWAIGLLAIQMQSNFPQFNEGNSLVGIRKEARDTRKFLKRDPQPAIGGPFLHGMLY